MPYTVLQYGIRGRGGHMSGSVWFASVSVVTPSNTKQVKSFLIPLYLLTKTFLSSPVSHGPYQTQAVFQYPISNHSIYCYRYSWMCFSGVLTRLKMWPVCCGGYAQFLLMKVSVQCIVGFHSGVPCGPWNRFPHGKKRTVLSVSARRRV